MIVSATLYFMKQALLLASAACWITLIVLNGYDIHVMQKQLDKLEKREDKNWTALCNGANTSNQFQIELSTKPTN